MSGDAAPQALAKFCAECGKELAGSARIAGKCVGCMTQDDALAVARRYHTEALAVLRAYDAAANARRLRDARDAAEEALLAAQERTPALEEAFKAAVVAERQAQDRAREAAEYARQCCEAERKAARDKASPQEQTEALARSRAAADVSGRERAAFEGAVAARQAAEEALNTCRGEVERLEGAAKEARDAASAPPEFVPMSEWTCALGHPVLVLLQPGIGDYERAAASVQVQTAAQLCGLADQLKAQGRAEGREELEKELRERAMLSRRLADGNLVAIPNPLSSRTPRP